MKFYFPTFQQCFDCLHWIIQELVILHDAVIHSKIWITQFQNFTVKLISPSQHQLWHIDSTNPILYLRLYLVWIYSLFNLQLCVQSFVVTAVTRATTNLYETVFPFIWCLLQWKVEELFFVVTNLIQLGYIKQWPMRGGVIASLICRKCIFCYI